MKKEKKEEILAQWRALRSRGELKRAAREIEREDGLRALLDEQLQERGLELVADLPVKKLLRMFLDRAEEAQIRKNPIHRNEGFVCIHCHQEIPKTRGKIRDHCPLCLRGVHLDNIPGDRASDCQGKLNPASFQLDHGIVVIQYQCERCEHNYQVKAHPDDNIPLSFAISDLP